MLGGITTAPGWVAVGEVSSGVGVGEIAGVGLGEGATVATGVPLTMVEGPSSSSAQPTANTTSAIGTSQTRNPRFLLPLKRERML